MTETVAVSSGKGGVGKTTIAVNQTKKENVDKEIRHS